MSEAGGWILAMLGGLALIGTFLVLAAGSTMMFGGLIGCTKCLLTRVGLAGTAAKIRTDV